MVTELRKEFLTWLQRCRLRTRKGTCGTDRDLWNRQRSARRLRTRRRTWMWGQMESGSELPCRTSEIVVQMWGLNCGRMRPRRPYSLHGSSEWNLLWFLCHRQVGHRLSRLVSKKRSSRWSERRRDSVVCDIRLALAPVCGIEVGSHHWPSWRGEFLTWFANRITRRISLSCTTRSIRPRFYLGGLPLGACQCI